ncbi:MULTISPECIES: hypothetical protein [Prochlorococcus]|uniref:hypothetical protein n=1 Tax=Prochlorococcus TaxID=1218 RepID=UPI000533BBE8|nr:MULTISPECIES: hypothetical protein [Prochlorococcus]KGG13247.1 DNA polymerasee III delta prime subunit [Prochlorococcus sp. MIT 0601]
MQKEKLMRKILTDNSLFEEVYYQPIAINILTEILISNKVAPAYIFSGPKGVGQKEVALRFLEGILTKDCYEPNIRKRLESLNHPDMLWVEPTYTYQGKLITQKAAKEKDISFSSKCQIRLDQVRNIKNVIGNQTIESKLSMVVIEDSELMNEPASNALLKALEDSKNVIFILISSRPEKLISTIKSRCQKIPFKPLNIDLMSKYFASNSKELSSSYINDNKIYLINLSNGSPELLRINIDNFLEVPCKILDDLKALPVNYLEALNIAKEIAENLKIDQQIWLTNFLQQYFWSQETNFYIVKRLDALRYSLTTSIQPRIAWEVALIELTKQQHNR